MTRLRWWLHRHAATLSYLLIVVIVAGLFGVAVVAGGGF